MFYQSGAALHPVAIVAVQGAVHIANYSLVNVATHHPIKSPSLVLLRHGHLKVADEIHRFVDLVSDQETPVNADGEVQEFLRLSPSEVVSRMQSGQFTVDACVSLAQSLAWLMAGSDANTASGNLRCPRGF